MNEFISTPPPFILSAFVLTGSHCGAVEFWWERHQSTDHPEGPKVGPPCDIHEGLSTQGHRPSAVQVMSRSSEQRQIRFRVVCKRPYEVLKNSSLVNLLSFVYVLWNEVFIYSVFEWIVKEGIYSSFEINYEKLSLFNCTFIVGCRKLMLVLFWLPVNVTTGMKPWVDYIHRHLS